jgi:hypothetical protein
MEFYDKFVVVYTNNCKWTAWAFAGRSQCLNSTAMLLTQEKAK